MLVPVQAFSNITNRCRLVMLCIALVVYTACPAQSYISRSAQLRFFSATPLEDIEAKTASGVCRVNFETGVVECGVLMKSFMFRKSLMQKHFNDSYVESDKYPQAFFRGTMKNYNGVTERLPAKVEAEGSLTLHGVTQGLSIIIEFSGTSTQLQGATTFKVKPADYKINIPALVRNNIAKEIEVFVSVPNFTQQ